MRIRFVRSGGFAGIRLAYEADTDTLPLQEAQRMKALIDESGFFRLPRQITPAGKGADQYNYSVTIENGEKTHTIQVSEAGVPAELRPLILFFMDKIKKK